MKTSAGHSDDGRIQQRCVLCPVSATDMGDFVHVLERPLSGSET
jgi:hypothetical protein